MPGRSIGNIEVTLTVDTSRVTREVLKATRVAGKAGGEQIEDGLNDVSFRELNTRLRELRFQAQRAMAGIEADIDFSDAEVRRDLREIEARLRATEIELRLTPELDSGSLLAQSESLRTVLRDLLSVDAEVRVSPEEARIAAAKADEAFGNISADVEFQVNQAELTRLRAQLREELREIGRGITFDFDLDVDDTDVEKVRAKIESLQAGEIDLELQIERASEIDTRVRLEALQRGINVDIGLTVDPADLAEAFAEIDAVRDAADIDMEIQLQRASVLAARLEAEQAGDGLQWTLGLDVDRSEVNSLLADVQSEFAGRDVDVDLNMLFDFERHDAIAKANEAEAIMNAALGDLIVDLGVDVDRADVFAAEEQIKREIGAIEVPIRPEVDDLAVARSKAKLDRLIKSSSSSADSDAHSLSLRLRAIFAAVATLTGPAGALAFGAVGDVVSIAGSAFNALASGIGAAAPLFAGLAGSVAAGVIAFKELGAATKVINTELKETSLSKQLESFDAADRVARGLSTTTKLTKEQRDALDEMGTAARVAAEKFDPFSNTILKAVEDLGPQTRGFALEVAKLAPQFQELKETVSEAVFRGMADELKFLSATLLPDLGDSLEILGGSFRTFLIEVGESARTIDFSGLAEGIAPALDDLSKSFGALIRASGKFFDAATGPAQTLASNIRRATERFEQFIDRVSESGQLEEFLQDGLESLSKWADLVGSVGKALFTLFQAGSEEGDGFVDSLTDVVDRFDSWMKSIEGQDALEEFFSTAKSITKDLLPLLKGAQGFFKELITDRTVDQFGDLTETLGDLLPFLGQIFEIVGRAGILQTVADAFKLVADAVQPIVPNLDALADSIGEGLQRALEAIAPSLPPLADAFGRLADALAEPIASSLEGIGGAFGVLVEVLTPVVDVIASIPEPLLEIATTALILDKAMSPLGTSVGKAIGFFTKLAKESAATGTSMSSLALTANPAALALVGVGLAAATAITIFQSYRKEQQEIIRNSEGIGKALSENVKEIVEGNRELGDTDAWQLLSEAMVESGTNMDSVRKSMGLLGLDMNDLADITAAFSGSAEQSNEAIFSLARQMGLTQEEAGLLAKAFQDAGGDVGDFRGNVKGIEDTLGSETFSGGKNIQRVAEEFIRLNAATSKTDLNLVAEQFVSMAGAGSEAEQALLAQAEALSGVDRTAANVIPLYETMIDLLAGTTEKTAAMIPPFDGLSVALGDVGAALQGTVDVAVDAEPDWAAMAGALRDITEASLELNDPVFRAAENFQDLRDAAKETADASDQVKQAWDELFSSGLDLQAVTDARIKGFNELEKRIREFGTQAAREVKAEDRYSLAIQGNSESAIENRELIRQRVEEIQAEEAQLVKSGKSNEEVTAAILEQRQALINVLGGFDLAGQSAEDYINTLGLTPENVLTAVNAPGLIEAKEGFDTMLTNIEELPPETLLKILTPGQLEALENSEEYKRILETTPGDVSTIFETPGMIEAIAGAANFKLTVEETPGGKITTIEVVGADEAKDEVDDLIASLDLLAEKATAEVLFGLTAANLPGHAHGGTVGPLGGVGSEFGQPELVTFNGQTALITSPTLLPPGAEVTPLTGNATGRVVNQNITVNTIVDDPILVAEQVMNRTAELLAT